MRRTPPPSRRRLYQCLSILLGLAVACVILEIPAWLGWIDYRLVLNTVEPQPWNEPENRLDPELHFVHRPHRRITGTMSGGDFGQAFPIPDPTPHHYNVATDRDGFRNPRDFETADIVVLGDSYVEGVLVGQENLLTSRLEDICNTRVRNLGHSGYGPQQYLIAFQRYGLPMRPKAAVWCFFEGNDLSDILQYAKIQSGWKERMAQIRSFRNRSFSTNLFRRWTSRLDRDSQFKPNGAQWFAFLPDGRRCYFFHQSNHLSANDFAAMQTLAILLSHWAAECREQEILPVFVYVPTKIRVYRSVCTFREDLPADRWVVEDLPNHIAQLVADVSPEIHYVDLAQPMIQAAQNGQLPYFLDDSHWTESGHELAAKAIAQALGCQR